MSAEGVKRVVRTPRTRQTSAKEAPIIKNIDDGEKLDNEQEELTAPQTTTKGPQEKIYYLSDTLKEVFDKMNIKGDVFNAYGFYDVSNDYAFKKCGKNNDIYILSYVIIAVVIKGKIISLDRALKHNENYELIKYPSFKVFINEKTGEELLKELHTQRNNKYKEIYLSTIKITENKNSDFGKYSLRVIKPGDHVENTLIEQLKESHINSYIIRRFNHTSDEFLTCSDEALKLFADDDEIKL